MVHIYGSTWPTRWGKEGEARLVKVYSNCEEVELFLNGRNLGKKKRDSQNCPAAGLRWRVQFETAENSVEAVGYQNGKQIKDAVTWRYETREWGEPAGMNLTTFRDAENETWVEALLSDGRLIDKLGTSSGARKVQVYNGHARIQVDTNGGDNVVAAASQGLKTQFVELMSE